MYCQGLTLPLIFERDVNFGVRWYNTVCLILLPVLWLDGVGQMKG